MPTFEPTGAQRSAAHVLRVDGPSALVACAPFLLGFAPERSLLVVFTHEDIVVLTLRFDVVTDPSARMLQEVHELFESTMRQIDINRVRVDQAHILVFSPDAPQRPGRSLLGVLQRVFDDHGVQHGRAFATDEERLWCYTADCQVCPGVGHELDDEQMAAVRFDLVSRGYGFTSSRRDLEAAVRPDAALFITDEQLDRHALSFLASEAADRRSAEDDIVAICEQPLDWQRIRDQGAFWAVALRDSRVREPVMYRLLTGPAGNRRRRLAGARVWLAALTRSLPDEWVAATAATLAAVAWQEGDGAFARIAADRALTADPTNTLAYLIDTAAGSGVPPSTWRQVLVNFGLAGLRQGNAYVPEQ